MESSRLLHLNCSRIWKSHFSCFSGRLQHDLSQTTYTVFASCESSLNGGCTMRGFEKNNIKGIARLLKILIGNMHLSVEILHFFWKVGMTILFSFTGFNWFVEEVDPICNKLLFRLLLYGFKIKFLLTFSYRQDEVFSLVCDFSWFCVKIEELINPSFFSTDLKNEIVEFDNISSSLGEGMSTLTMQEKNPSSSM